MSESLKECEAEGFEPSGDHVARGKWQCPRCSSPEGKMEWESRVDAELIGQREAVDAGSFIEAEHRAFREAVGAEIEKHLKEH